jgi:CDP-diacylglycerol--glycerol-3-phosphate 3-phosphatidyltransferase
MKQLNVPNMLTLFRLIASPLVMPVLFVYALPANILWLNLFLAFLFILLSMTDFFDGYLARKYNQETVIGRMLDPLADKFLTYSAFIGLLAAGKIYFYWVIILIGREFFIMGLRYVALEFSVNVSVSLLGKIKTVLQMACIAVIIANPYQQLGMQEPFNGVEMGLLLLSTAFSVISAIVYYDDFMKKFRENYQRLPWGAHHDQHE